MTIRRELLDAFARAIWVKSEAARSRELTDLERRRLMESIADDIKKCTDLTRPRVSEAARAEAKRLGLDRDLTMFGWHDQPRFDPRRKVFHWEHVITVKAIQERCMLADSPDAIVKILDSAQVAWILKSEDRRLTDLGYRSNRPDPFEAYRAAGIKLTE